MLIAQLIDDIVTASETTDKTLDYSCPYCKTTLILRRGEINKPHFSHASGVEDCPKLIRKDPSGDGRFVEATKEIVNAAKDALKMYRNQRDFDESVTAAACNHGVDPNDLMSYIGSRHRRAKYDPNAIFSDCEYESERLEALNWIDLPFEDSPITRYPLPEELKQQILQSGEFNCCVWNTETGCYTPGTMPKHMTPSACTVPTLDQSGKPMVTLARLAQLAAAAKKETKSKKWYTPNQDIKTVKQKDTKAVDTRAIEANKIRKQQRESTDIFGG